MRPTNLSIKKSPCQDSSPLFTRKALLIIALAVLIACSARSPIVEKQLAHLDTIKRPLAFAVLGDSRSGEDIYQRLIAQALRRRPDFLVNVGDMVNSLEDKANRTYLGGIQRAIPVPYFLTPGNHEISREGDEQLYRDLVHLPGNELYYSFEAGNSLFVVLDSEVYGETKKIAGTQYEWLDKTLSRSRHRFRFVFVHRPLFSEPGRGRHFGESLDKHPGERDRLQELFVKHKVTMVFSGHEHLYLRKSFDGIPHITTGGGGSPLYADEQSGGFHHFVLISVEDGRVRGEVIDLEGRVRDSFALY